MFFHPLLYVAYQYVNCGVMQETNSEQTLQRCTKPEIQNKVIKHIVNVGLFTVFDHVDAIVRQIVRMFVYPAN